VQPRGGNRALQCHAFLGVALPDLGHGGGDAAGAGGAESEGMTIAMAGDRGRHVGDQPGTGGGSHQPSRVELRFAQAVVAGDAGAGDGDAGAIAIAQSHGHQLSAGIGHREVRGAAAASLAQLPHQMLRFHQGLHTAASQWCLPQGPAAQAEQGHLGPGMAQGPQGFRAPHATATDEGRCPQPLVRPINGDTLQRHHPDQAAQGRASHRRGRIEGQLEAAAAQDQWTSQLRSIGGQILPAHQAAAVPHRRGKDRGDLPLIEGPCPFPSDQLQAVCHVGKLEPLPSAGQTGKIGAEAGPALWLAMKQRRPGDLQPGGGDAAEGKPLTGQSQGRGQHLGPGQSPVPLPGHLQGRKHPWNGDGGRTGTHPDAIAIGQVDIPEVHGLACAAVRCPGDAVGPVDQFCRATGAFHHQEGRAPQ
jgi:hypothetical protein